MASLQPVLEAKERERIREALKAYKQGHGIGDPALHKRMLRVLDCLDSELPLPTLQRFLRGTHRTDDGMVRRYARFLEQVAPTPHYEKMGDAIAEFYREGSRTPRAHVTKRLMRLFARRYFCYARGKSPYGITRTELTEFPRNADDSPGGINFKIPHSILEFEPLPGTVFLRATEWVYNPDRWPRIEKKPAGWGPETTWLQEGTLAQIRDWQHFMIILRWVKPYELPHPRVYMLQPVEEPQRVGSDEIKHVPLHGYCISTRTTGFEPGRHDFDSFEVRLYPEIKQSP